MKKVSALLATTLFASLCASSAIAGDINVNDGDSIKIATPSGLAGAMRFVAKDIAPNTYVDIPLNEGFVQLTFRMRGNSGLVSFSQTFDGAIISNPIYVDPGYSLLSKVYIDRSNTSILRIQNPSNLGRTLLVTGYILGM